MTDEELKGGWVTNLVRGTDVKPAALELIGEGLFLKNNLNLLYGTPGLGKSTLLAWLGAQIGGPVLWLSVEEDPATTTARYVASGGEPGRIYFLPPDENDWPSFELAKAPEQFRTLCQDLTPSLIVMDPATRFLGQINDNLEIDVRSALEELGRIVIAQGTTAVVLRHENKGDGTGLQRVLGATAWSATPRCAVRLYAEKGVLYAERTKCNQAPPLPRKPCHLVSVGDVARFEFLEGEAAARAMQTTTPEAVGAAALGLLGDRDRLPVKEAREKLPDTLSVPWSAVQAHLGASVVLRVDGVSVRVYRRDQLERIAAGQDLSGINREYDECIVCGARHAPWVEC